MKLLKKEAILFIFLSLMLAISQLVWGMGVIEMGNVPIYFEPGNELDETRYFELTSSGKDVSIHLEGRLAEYATVDKEVIRSADRDRQFNVRIQFKKKHDVPPGHHKIYIKLNEIIGPSGATVGTSINVITGIVVHVIYPGKYAEFTSLKVSNTGENGTITMTATLNSYGDTDIENAMVLFIITDKEDHELKRVLSKSRPLSALESLQFYEEINTTGIVPGVYYLKATAVTDTQELKLKKEFRIGGKTVDIMAHDSIFETGKISPFSIKIRSNWNEPMAGVYGIFNISDNLYKTPTIELAAWEDNTLSGYVDVSALAVGNYSANIRVYFEDIYVNKPITLQVIEEIIELPEEKPGISLKLKAIIIISLAIAILLIADVIWIRSQIKKKKRVERKDE